MSISLPRTTNYISDTMNSEHRLSESGCYRIEVSATHKKAYKTLYTAMHATVAKKLYEAIDVHTLECKYVKKRLVKNEVIVSREISLLRNI